MSALRKADLMTWLAGESSGKLLLAPVLDEVKSSASWHSYSRRILAVPVEYLDEAE